MLRLLVRACPALMACAGAIGCADGFDSSGSARLPPSSSSGENAEPVAGAASAAAGSATDMPAEPVPTASDAAAVIAPRIRRLTNAEYDATVQALLGTETAPGAQFVPDARLYKYAKFDRNEAQVVDPMLARQLQQAAESLATEYVENTLDSELPCAPQADAACARTFFESFLPKAYRRPVLESELADLLSVVVTPALARDGFRAAVELGIEAVLQSTAFLYHTELGDVAADPGPVTLTNAEIAEAMAYLLTGAPADATLLGSDLHTAAVRETEARRLLQSPEAPAQVERMVKQWLDIDQTKDLVKDKNEYPNFAPTQFDHESNDFIQEVVFDRNGDFELLLGADFTVGTAQLAETYGAAPPPSDPGIISLTDVPRRGILNLGAFLVSFPSPIKRGARVLTQALCIELGDPNALGLRVALPPLNASKTRRERFEEHNQAPCVSCHNMIDSVGFTFEHFNELGEWEAAESDDPELPIDSTVTLALPADIPFGTQAVADSAELARLASESEAGRRCFARNLARFTTAAHGPELEQGFIDEWERLRETGQDSVKELLVAYVRSDLFVERDPQAEVLDP